MQVSVETLGTLERRLTVSVPSEQLHQQVRNRLGQLGRTVRLKGFRPGKIPAKVVEQRFGAEVRNEALGELIRDSFNAALRQENLRIAGNPSIELSGTPDDAEIQYVATFEVMPDIGPIDVSALDISKPTASVEDADIDTMIETLRQQRRSWTEVERAAQAGDMVLFESWAEVEGDRVPAEGLERSGTVIGSAAMLPALEEKLVGLAPGASSDFAITFPDDYRIARLAGKTAQMHVTMVRVSEATLPELDEAFIASFGIAAGDVGRFRAEVRANLERELKAALMARLKAITVEKLVEAYAHIEFPSRMVEAEARALAQQAEAQARQQGQGEVKIGHENFLDAAKQRVAAAVLLGEIARQNAIRLDSARVGEMLGAIASTYEEPEQVVELYRKDAQLMQGLQNRVLEDQVIDWIADHAKSSTLPLSFSEVMRPGRIG